MIKKLNISKMDSIYLKVFIIEPILVSCINEASFYDIYFYLQKVYLCVTERETKDYLFYLINGSFIDYNGSNKSYSISQDGIDLLDIIYSQKIRRVVDYSNLTVKVK